MWDLAIIGAGPVGLAAAIEAKRQGISLVVLEKGTVANSIYCFPRGMSFFSEAGKIEIGGHPMVSAAAKPTREEALRYYQRVAAREGFPIRVQTEVVNLAARPEGFELEVSYRGEKNALQAQQVIVATGYFDTPNKLGVPGEDLPQVSHSYPDPALYYGQEVAIIGGSNSAVEAALDLYRSGAQVTLIHRDSNIRPSVKYWLKPDFENRVKEGNINALFDHKVNCFTAKEIYLEGPDGPEKLTYDSALVMTGYHGNDNLLHQAGAEFKNGQPALDRNCQTTLRGLYVLGSAGYGQDTRNIFIENGRDHVQDAISQILKHSQAT